MANRFGAEELLVLIWFGGGSLDYPGLFSRTPIKAHRVDARYIYYGSKSSCERGMMFGEGDVSLGVVLIT
ncbi:hypothetical protein TNCV_3854661 [Trichonephila clavipes]|nr:hypothetical protein TNCV_3854661 [Trichonephila clavipes]